jgi:hypothetical protein
VVIGELPAPQPPHAEVRAAGSVAPVYGLAAFAPGVAFDLQIDGPGSVEFDRPGPLYREGEPVTLTAVPVEGAFFIRWLRASTSRDPVLVLGATDAPLVARFSDRPEFFTTWRAEHFSPEELGDLAVSGAHADPDLDSFTNAAEYAFGSDPRASEGGVGLKFRLDPGTPGRVSVSYRRPTDAADVAYTLLYSTDMRSWQDVRSGGSLFDVSGESVAPAAEGLELVSIELVASEEPPGAVVFRLSAEVF